MIFYTLDDSGQPVLEPDHNRWADWIQKNFQKRVVAIDEIDFKTHGPKTLRNPSGWTGYTVRVSTVFLGLDHNYFGGKPVLFETMVFGGLLDQEVQRYHTKAEALTGHSAMMARVFSAETTPGNKHHVESNPNVRPDEFSN